MVEAYSTALSCPSELVPHRFDLVLSSPLALRSPAASVGRMSRRRAGDSSAPVYRACCAAPSRKCVQVIAEIFGDDPFSENVLPTMAHAKEALLAPHALVMPGRLRVVAALAASHELWSQNRSAGESRCLAPDLVVPTLQPSRHRRPSRAEPTRADSSRCAVQAAAQMALRCSGETRRRSTSPRSAVRPHSCPRSVCTQRAGHC